MMIIVLLLLRRPARSTRTDTSLPDTTRFRSRRGGAVLVPKSRLGCLAAGALSRDPRRASPGCVIPRRGRGGGTGRGRPRRLKPLPRQRQRDTHAIPAPPGQLLFPAPPATPLFAGGAAAARGPHSDTPPYGERPECRRRWQGSPLRQTKK